MHEDSQEPHRHSETSTHTASCYAVAPHSPGPPPKSGSSSAKTGSSPPECRRFLPRGPGSRQPPKTDRRNTGEPRPASGRRRQHRRNTWLRLRVERAAEHQHVHMLLSLAQQTQPHLTPARRPDPSKARPVLTGSPPDACPETCSANPATSTPHPRPGAWPSPTGASDAATAPSRSSAQQS